MFDADELERVVDLQGKSYRLLRWVGESLNGGTLTFNTVHEAMGLTEAARDWLTRHYASLPSEARPDDKADLPAFASLFASYLTTSFELIEKPGARRISSSRCYCSYCSYLSQANYLRARTPGKKAQASVRQMKELYLNALLADVAKVPDPHARANTVLENPALAPAVSYATYGRELVRRSEWASQGEGVLVLWREIAWERGKLKKNFTLSARAITNAEAAIVEQLLRAVP